MLRKAAKIWILLEIIGGMIISILALFFIAGFCLNNDLNYRPIFIAGAIIIGLFSIAVFYVSVKDLIDILKE